MLVKIFKSHRWLQLSLGLFILAYIKCDCPFPVEEIKNGKYKYASNTKGKEAQELYVLRFECFPGYERIGPRFIQCVEGEWTDVVPICKERTCFEPPDIANGAYEIHGGPLKPLTINTLVSYSCNEGYELSDSSSSHLVCILDEESGTAIWTGKMPFCEERKNCHDPGVSKHGTRNGDCCFAGNVLHFSCEEDFELVGSEEITCLPSGLWSHNRPLCRPSSEASCDLPPLVPHGVVTGEKDGDYFLAYDEAEILCEPGYSYKGPTKYVMCEEDGQWEAEFGECTEIYCDRPEPFANGTISELESTDLLSFPYNFELNYICVEGYRLLGGDSWRICRKNGWSGKTPYCEEIRCPDPGIPENGDREGNNFAVGAKVRFKCFTGYYLLGSFERFCMPNGQWTGELSRCDTSNNYCPNPGIPINGFKNSSRYDIGDAVGFRCSTGYINIGSETRVCLPNTTWSGTEAKCLSPYDYDNTAQISAILKAKVEQQFNEEFREVKRYQQAVAATGRMLDLNYDGRLILYFAFDVSGSVGEQHFNQSIDFAKAIVKKVGVHPDGTRVGAMIFSSKAKNVVRPRNDEVTTVEGVFYALDNIKYTGGGTSTSSALALMKMNLMTDEQYFKDSNRKTVLFVITDGRANMGGNPEEDAETLRNMGTDIYCIGITGDVRQESLYKIASTSLYGDVERKNVFILKGYSSFPGIIQEITNGTVDYSQCGLGKEVNDNRGRILDGKQSNEPWPWMAAIYSLKPGTKDVKEAKLMCGGSIINRNFILTAAHCMYEENRTAIFSYRLRRKEEIIVKLGLTDIADESKWTLVQDFSVKTMHIHSKFERGPSYDYDIALLELDRPIVYDSYIRPICLPPKELPSDSSFYKANEFAWVTGWGHEGIVRPDDLNAIFRISKTLKELKLPIQSRERCEKSLEEQKNFNTSYFTERMFCAGDGQTGNDTCRGDSGGPLMQQQMNEEGYLYWTQVGIVSWGIGCGVEDLYGHYTHVHNLLPWIEEKTRTLNNATNESVEER